MHCLVQMVVGNLLYSIISLENNECENEIKLKSK